MQPQKQQNIREDYIESEQEQQQEQDSCLQKQAFPLDQINLQQCNQNERQAFIYLLKVRQQANKLKQENKHKKQKQSLNIPENQPIKKENIAQQQYWFTLWKQETLNNWKCIIQNCKYLLKNQEQFHSNENKKINIDEVPNIYGIIGLPLGKIQEIIRSISEEYINSKHGKYYLWIYSLLAVHQSKASYKHFQVLADINACIQNQQTINLQILLVIVLLQQHFHQKHLSTKCIPCISC